MNEIWTDSFLQSQRYETDETADAVIEQIVAENGPGEARDLFDKLIREVELPVGQLPQTAQQFITENNQLPGWAVREKIKKGEELFIDHGPKFLLMLYYKSLPMLYGCRRGAQVLAMTGRLTHQPDSDLQFSRRIAETGQFLIDVMSPGSLVNNGKGIQTALKVRLIHASIRHFIPAERWDEADLGKPINQEDMAITLMTFSVALLDTLNDLDIEVPTDQAEGYFHCWRIIGQVMGIRPELLPETIDDGRLLMNKILDRNLETSAEGKLLTDALVKFSMQHIPLDQFKMTPQIMIRFFAGERIANVLGVKTHAGCLTVLLPHFVKLAMGWIEKLEDRSEPARLIIDTLSRQATLKMVDFFNEYKEAKFHVPDELKRQWGIH